MSGSRAALLEMLRDQPEPISQAALAKASGLHGNTVREHLEALVRQGLVRRRRAKPTGRGRPAWLYQATETAEGSGAADYARLATALASVIHRTSASPEADAAVAGEEWGRELARDRGATGATDLPTARRAVVSLLDDLRFAPEPDDQHQTVHLTRCPLLEAAHRYPNVVCAVHLGLVGGALREYGADPASTDLVPFARPGACRLELPAGEG